MTDATILIPCLLTGGTEVATYDTARALQAIGYQVNVIVYFDEVDQAMLATFRSAGVVVHKVGLRRDGGLFRALQLAWTLWRQLRGRRHALIWVQYMTPTLLPLLISRLFTRRLITAVHVAAGHYRSRDLKRLRWLARQWCNRLICVSETTARGIFGSDVPGNMARRRVRVIANAIDMTVVDAAQPRDWKIELNLPDDAFVIGYVGRLAENKGVDVLLKAMHILMAHDARVLLVVVGEGSALNSLKALAGKLGLSGRIYFVGAVPRYAIYSAFKGFDIAVVPSREEGFGLSALEAMACGVPLVASRVDALEEVVLDGKTGLLVEPVSAEDLAGNLLRLFNNANLRGILSHAGSCHVRDRYDRRVQEYRLHRLIMEFS